MTEIKIVRPVLTAEKRDHINGYRSKQHSGITTKVKDRLQNFTQCSKSEIWNRVTSFIPILDWLPNYQWKNWLLGDAIAGMTIAIMHIPQGMGFALLANIPAICGIYMAFFQSLIYSVFATSKHCSMGTFAVITLMTGKLVNELSTHPVGAIELVSNDTSTIDTTETNADTLDNIDPIGVVYSPIAVATIVCFMTGFWEILMGVLHVGSLSVYLSDMLVSGFTTAAAVHVLTSQLKDILGIKPQSYSGPFKIIKTYISIFQVLPSMNVATVIISVISLALLIVNNEILKPRLAKYTKIPVPIELIVVVIGTLSSYYGLLSQNYGVNILGEIPTGLPAPELPPLDLIGKVASESLVIAIVSYTITFCQGKIFAERNNYVVDANQELYAQGLCNLFSSFFSCAPSAAALARTLIQAGVGGVTQLASIICCFLLLFVLLFIGPVFESLPNSCLACIIVVALKGMFMQVFDMVAQWKISKADAIVWILTFLSVVIIDIDYGLFLGVVAALILLLTRNQRTVVRKLARMPSTEIYLDIDKYNKVIEEENRTVISIIGPIHFANKDSVKEKIIQLCPPDEGTLKKIEEKDMQMMEVPNGDGISTDHSTNIHPVILDLTGLSYIDPSGCKVLAKLQKDFKETGKKIFLTGVTERIQRILQTCNLNESFPESDTFHSIHDAVVGISAIYPHST